MKKIISTSRYIPFAIMLSILVINIFIEKVLKVDTYKILLAIVILYLIGHFDYSLYKQEETISTLNEKVNKQLIKTRQIIEVFKGSSYKLELTIVPNWNALLDRLAVNGIDTIHKHITNIKDRKEMKIDEEKSLLNKEFGFISFYNSIAKTEQIWSEYLHAFVDDFEVKGNILYSRNKVKGITTSKYNEIELRLLFDDYVISPYCIEIEEDEFLMKTNRLSCIPYYQIQKFFIELASYCDPMHKVKNFPESLSLKMKDFDVRYDTLEHFNPYGTDEKEAILDIESDWAAKNNVQIFEKRIERHIFISKYYNLYFRMVTQGWNEEINDLIEFDN